MTRFGEISPLWQKLNEGLFGIWQKLLATSANFVYNWAICHGCKWKNNENFKCHLVTLLESTGIGQAETICNVTMTRGAAANTYLKLNL